MKINKIISLVIGLAIVTSSCTVNEFNEQVLPAGEYVRLSLSGGDGATAPTGSRAIWDDPNGKGSLSFKWETVEIDSDKTENLTLVVSDGVTALANQASATSGSTDPQQSHTGVAVTPNPGDAHRADFRTVRYYSTNDLNSARYVYAVAGKADVTVDDENDQHICKLAMPSSFTQSANQDPSFLRDYMYMYATAAYDVNQTTLRFKHIPATFRFIISNGSDNAVTLNSISLSVLGGGAVASKSTDVIFGWSGSDAALSSGAEAYETVSTVLSGAVTVEKGKKYTAYTMALPLASNESFRGKTLSFSAQSSTGESLSFFLDAETLANANGSGIYNWVGGKSYTIKLNIGDVAKVSGEVLSNKDITVSSTVEGTFTLRYVDAAGEPLADYAAICALDVDQIATYEAFVDSNIAPYSADAVGIYDEAGEKVGSLALNSLRMADNSGLQYRVGMLSDVHLNTQNSSYSDCFGDFENALKFFNSSAVNAALTCICGDITEHGTEAELARYQSIVSASSLPAAVYTTSGNHDATQGGINLSLWEQYTGKGLTFEVSKKLPNGKTDHFLFLGMKKWNFTEAYATEDINWLKYRLESYKNERCFVITHLFFPDRAGNMLEIYPVGNWLTGVQLNTLEQMCDKYKNSIWFSGHSHWKWDLQKFDQDANVYRNPEAGWSVHLPSCAKPSDSNGTTREEKTALSEGAVINVYENHIDVVGVDFISGLYLPIASYRLDTELQEMPETPIDDTYLTADKFTYNKGQELGEMSVEDVPGMPGYVDIIFSAPKQGYYVKNNTFITGYEDGSLGVDINVEYLECWTGWGTENAKEVSMVDYVGFYGALNSNNTNYHLASNSVCYPNAAQGVQFQTSSSCTGPYPIRLRMKARAEFYLKDDAELSDLYLTAADFYQNPDKNTGAIVTDVEGMPGYVDVIFDKTSQGFYTRNHTFTEGYDSDYQGVNITVEDMQCWTGWDEATQSGTKVSTIAKVGFYDGGYNLTTTGSCYVNAKYGVQFHTSSSCTGPFPIKIRMKVREEFYMKSGVTLPNYYINASDFSHNSKKVEGAIVKDVEGMPDYVDVTFTKASQGFYITNDTHSSSSNKVEITLEDAKVVSTDGTEVSSSVPAGVGFFGYDENGTEGYYMDTMTITKLGTEGVCFQISGSKYSGDYPITIRMKAKLIFY